MYADFLDYIDVSDWTDLGFDDIKLGFLFLSVDFNFEVLFWLDFRV